MRKTIETGPLLTHADRELQLAGAFDEPGDYGDMLGHAVMRMVKEYASACHSDFNASTVLSMFTTVVDFKPLTPLTGEDSEWSDVGNGQWQNNRCSRVFKNAERAWDINGKVFREPDGCTYTSGDSHVTVTFPYTPATEYVDVEQGAGQVR